MKCPRCGLFVELPPPGGYFHCPTLADYGGCYFRNKEHWSELIPDKPRDPLLVEREKTHGSFERNAELSQRLKLLFDEFGLNKPGEYRWVHREALDMIALKISRILSGQPMTKDHWDDIAGYAKLGAEACEG